ncbi:MAG: 5-(carboxyamino)imidazole ribonucleotide synthase [Gemmatales bacterium]|nr:5-(carboxyamino)imidazole ribonucleotide synthase [Gemmatales bacterium]MDW8385444.1 5-(carboxyamino)imidazole ribonucleotide synthase [Gemmatales bacterium]
MSGPILPGSVIGVLGSGQLGRMFALAARRMGYRVHTFSPDSDTPTGQIADVEITASYDDLDAVRRFASQVRVLTFEFENVPAATTAAAAELVPVRPSGEVLFTTQNRLREKTFLRQHGFPTTEFRAVRSAEELRSALQEIGLPAVLKTAGYGYDGKGQHRIASLAEIAPLESVVQQQDHILEAFVDFACELSVVAARGLDGALCHWGPILNTHSRHILDTSVCPAGLPGSVEKEAVAIAHAILEALDVVGVLCVEFFLTRSGRLLVNELAPRPHNSGHLTIDACVTSQFEQQLRAVCGLPLGAVTQLKPAAMANLLGDLWRDGEPDWTAACRFPDVKLHLYGKVEARVGRKMGHLTTLADTAEEALRRVMAARAALRPGR